MHRLPTKLELQKRDIDVGDAWCDLCEDGLDSTLHLFTECKFAMEVWHRIGTWCRLPPIFAFDVRDLLCLFKDAAGGKQGKRIVQGIVIVALWCIWLARNEKSFNQREVKENNIGGTLITLQYNN
ncbi:uncharacterized protein LOC110925150 [Helianthus annuus]|uniref:uncharacterized protein LOC110925150 n=1 Tax=Helianthus annuus TaxID=4232 RepID=UPI000B8F0557|nr:uncharacterized protein LOC110925150 [Helianthus annuus]